MASSFTSRPVVIRFARVHCHERVPFEMYVVVFELGSRADTCQYLVCRWHQGVLKASRRPCTPRSTSIPAAVTQSAEIHPTLWHSVAPDDTLWDISVRYGVSMRSIKSVNSLPADFVNIQPGQLLALPAAAVDAAASVTDAPKGEDSLPIQTNVRAPPPSRLAPMPMSFRTMVHSIHRI